MTTSKLWRNESAIFTALLALWMIIFMVFGQCTARSAETTSDEAATVTPPRLRFIDGEVSFWRPGAEDWTTAQINTPLAAGDGLYAGDASNMEVEVGRGAYIRAGTGSQVGLESIEPTFLQVKVTSGHVAFDFAHLLADHSVEIDTPNAAMTITGPGYYRLDITDDSATFATRRGGAATVSPAVGDAFEVTTDQQAVISGMDAVQVNVEAVAALDTWDHWNMDRAQPKKATVVARTASPATTTPPRAAGPEAPTAAGRPRTSEPTFTTEETMGTEMTVAAAATSSPSVQYFSDEVAGVEDLDGAGAWEETADYGHVWTPANVAADWAPYTAGRWVFDPTFGWSWVDDSSWGWAPFHYGRWVTVGGRWAWAPGPVARPVYSPALVGFLATDGGVAVGISADAPAIGWVALGFGEAVIPWWGRSEFVGRPYWGGWGGPRVVNNVVIKDTTKIVNVNSITTYQNVGAKNAVVAVDRGHFADRASAPVHVAASNVRNMQPVHGALAVKPTAASLVTRSTPAAKPSQQTMSRPVVATRAPQDSTAKLRAAGLQTHAPVQSKPNRLVSVPARGQVASRPAAPGNHALQPHGPIANGSVPTQTKGMGTVSGRAVVPPPPPHGSQSKGSMLGKTETKGTFGTTRRTDAPVPTGMQHSTAPTVPGIQHSTAPTVPGARRAETTTGHSAPSGKPVPSSTTAHAAGTPPAPPSKDAHGNRTVHDTTASPKHAEQEHTPIAPTRAGSVTKSQPDRAAEATRRQGQEAARRQQQDAARQRPQEHGQQQPNARQQQEAAHQQQENAHRQQQDSARQQQENAHRQQQDSARQQQENAHRQQQDSARQQQENARRQQQESARQQQEAARQQQEAARRAQEQAAQQAAQRAAQQRQVQQAQRPQPSTQRPLGRF